LAIAIERGRGLVPVTLLEELVAVAQIVLGGGRRPRGLEDAEAQARRQGERPHHDDPVQ